MEFRVAADWSKIAADWKVRAPLLGTSMPPDHIPSVPNIRGCISAAYLSGPSSSPDGAALFEFRFPADDPLFAGHFPGHPLLPGIFQIELARFAGERLLGCRLEIREIPKAKFLRPILPEEIIRLSLKFTEQGNIIDTRTALVVGGQAAGEAALKLCRKV